MVGKACNPENYDRDIWVEIPEDAGCTDPISFLGLQRCHPSFLVRTQKTPNPTHKAISTLSLLAFRTITRIKSLHNAVGEMLSLIWEEKKTIHLKN